jgi:NAD+ diphosphatase
VTAFTGARLDRAGDGRRRDPAWIASLRADPAARAVVAGTRGVRLAGDRLAIVALADAGGAAEPLLLGLDADGPLFAVDEDVPPPGSEAPPPVAAGAARGEPARGPQGAEAPDGSRPVGLRDAVVVLPQDESGLVAYAAALINWHRRNRFCAVCGAASEVGEGGLVRTCARCGTEHHPRTDPVVIMLVTDGDRVLLGRQAVWPPRRYSALAGFVEPGESLEEAVAREVREESGVEIEAPEYVESQPWPFPASLMLGFRARWRSGTPRPEEGEIEDVRWFSRDEVAAAAAEDEDGWGSAPGPHDGAEGLLLPPRIAIARRLVERWLDQAGGCASS